MFDYKRNWYKYLIVAFLYTLSYFFIFQTIHYVFDLSTYINGKFLESLIMCIFPMIVGVLTGFIFMKDNLKIINIWYMSIIPVVLIERIGMPIYGFVTAGSNWQENLGFSSDSIFLKELWLGNIGSAYYYNWFYLFITIIILPIMTIILKKEIFIIRRRTASLWVIVLNLAILPTFLDLFTRLDKIAYFSYFITCFVIGLIIHLIIRLLKKAVINE